MSSTRIADLYADLSIRGGDDFDSTLKSGRQSLQQMGKQADETAERTRQSAIRTTNAYERVSQELAKTRQAYQRQAQEARDSAQREEMALERLTRARERYGDSSDQAASAEQTWQRAQRESERAAQRAERQLDQLRIAQGRTADAARRAAQDMQRAGQQMGDAFPDDIAPDTSGMGDAGEEGGDAFGGGFMVGARGALSSLGTKAGPIAAAVAGVAAVGMAAGTIFAKAIAEGAQREADQNLVQAQLGIDDETAARLGRAASEAYMGNFGETVQANMDSIRAAIQSGLLPRDAGQDAMQDMAQKLSTVAKIMGSEVPEVARAAGQAIKTGLVRDGAEAMDLLVAATQKGLNINDDLLDTVNEYGTQFRKMGLSGQEAMGLIAQAMKGGARDADIAADAIKEVAIRAIDGSKSTTNAFKDLNLNPDEMADRFAAGGKVAHDALGQVLEAIRKTTSDTERASIAQALFGTQLEDLGGAFDQFDLSKAGNELGNVADAAQRAQDKMGEDAGASWEGMRRTVEEQINQIKQAMAEAFGPTVADMAKGLAENKDEIIGFFVDLASAGLTLGIALGNVAAGILHTWGFLAKGFGTVIGGIMKYLGTAYSTIGNLVSKIPALKGLGDGMKSAGDMAVQAGNGMMGFSDQLHGMANTIADQVVPGLAAARDAVEAIPADKTIQVTDQGGNQVVDLLKRANAEVTVNNNKEIEVSAPLAQNVLDQLRSIGIEVQQRGEKQVLVKMDRVAYDNFKRDVSMGGTFKVLTQLLQGGTPPPSGFNPNSPGLAIPAPRADGGIDGPLPNQATIAPANRGRRGLIQWAEAETGGEAYIPLASSKRGRSTSILADVAQRFGFQLYRSHADGAVVPGGFIREPYGLDPSTNTGGYGSSGAVFPQWVHAIEQAFGVKASTYAGHQVVNGRNTGIDWSGPVEAMQKLAEYFASIKEQMRQVIWMNPGTGQQIGVADGQMVGPGTSQPGYYRDDWDDHMNHVHSSQLFSLPAPGQLAQPQGQQQVQTVRTIPLVQRPDGTWTSTDPEWAKLIARESGGRADRLQEIQDANSGGNEASGLFQIARGTWAANGGLQYAKEARFATAEQQAIIAARIFDKSGGSPWGSGKGQNLGRENEDALRAGITTMVINQYGQPDPNALNQNQNNNNDEGSKTPPEDPTKVTLEFDNPFAPFWWKGEKEYRQRILDDAEKQKKWDEYQNGGGKNDPHKGMKKETVKSVSEAEEDLREARADRDITLQRQREMKPDAEESQKMSMREQVRKANDKVREAERDLADAKANPSGYKYVPDPEKQQPGQVQRYAMGDIRNGHQPEIVRPGDYRMWGEPESGGESYIPHAADRRGRALDIWAKTGKILGVQGFDGGGFAGYTPDTRDASAPKNLYDLLSLGVGAGFTAANAIGPYAQMLMTGKVDLGNMTPKVDMKANSEPITTSYVSGVASQISSQLSEIVWAIKEGKDIRVTINDATGPAGLSLTRRGN